MIELRTKVYGRLQETRSLLAKGRELKPVLLPEGQSVLEGQMLAFAEVLAFIDASLTAQDDDHD